LAAPVPTFLPGQFELLSFTRHRNASVARIDHLRQVNFGADFHHVSGANRRSGKFPWPRRKGRGGQGLLSMLFSGRGPLGANGWGKTYTEGRERQLPALDPKKEAVKLSKRD
jgi:hypothetical protein